MGRNKDIKELHELTGFKYSELRKALKANSWNGWRALCDLKGIDPDSIFELGTQCAKFMRDFSESLRPVMEAIANITETFAEAISSEGLALLEAGGETNE